MAKIHMSAAILGLAFTAAIAAPAFAIENETECVNEGGTMTNVKDSDYCLVPIRKEAYRGEEYDGNKLGVSECPGDVLNDGAWCMIPVSPPKTTATGNVEKTASEKVMDKAKELAKDKVEEKVEDET